MSESLELRLEVVPGRIKAVGVPRSVKRTEVQNPILAADSAGVLPEKGMEFQVFLEIPVWPAAKKRDTVRRLATNPGEVYGLLQGRIVNEALEQQLLPTNEELELTDLGLGSLHDDHKSEVLKKVREHLAREPWLAFTLRGMTKAELLEGAFALWAEAEIENEAEGVPPQTGELAAELARLERKGPPLSSSEWLAEAAAEGSLHQPGTLFHEIEERTFPSAPVIAAATEDWQPLLPHTPKAKEGLALIMRRVADAAARRAAKARKP